MAKQERRNHESEQAGSQMKEDDALMNEAEWETEGELRQPSPNLTSVVSVRFSREEAAEIRDAASRIGERTSEFIRRAAVDRARTGVVHGTFRASGYISMDRTESVADGSTARLGEPVIPGS